MRFTLVLIPLIAHIYVIASQNTIYNFGLCITGQLGRLQLESKVKFLLEPLILRRNNAIDIVLILEDNDELVYVNGHGDRQLLYNSSDEIVEALQPYSRKVIVNLREKKNEPVLWQHYVDNLGEKFTKPPKGPKGRAEKNKFREKSTLRAKSHVTQWYSFRRCYEMFEELELEHNHRYDALIRLRDDGALVRVLDPFRVKHDSSHAIISSCDVWGSGYNDKGVMLSRSAARGYFNGFLDLYYFNNHHLLKYDISSPEKYTKAVLHHYNISVTESVYLFPTIPQRIIGHKDDLSPETCFRIFGRVPTSAPCYLKELPSNASFIESHMCQSFS